MTEVSVEADTPTKIWVHEWDGKPPVLCDGFSDSKRMSIGEIEIVLFQKKGVEGE